VVNIPEEDLTVAIAAPQRRSEIPGCPVADSADKERNHLVRSAIYDPINRLREVLADNSIILDYQYMGKSPQIG
jgi:hypothetical protein